MQPSELGLPLLTGADPGADLACVGVVGSINQDTIEHADGRRSHSLGGVLFTACALAHLGKGRLRTHPIARVNTALKPRLVASLGSVPAMSTDGLLAMVQPGYHCHIRYADDGSKTEVLQGQVPSLDAVDLEPWLDDLDALIINFITGFEVELGTLHWLRTEFDGPLLMDLHSLTLGRDGVGRRFLRSFDLWPQWVQAADVLQMNEEEARCLGAPADDDELRAWAAGLLDLGPKVAVITLGHRGTVAAYRGTDGTVRHARQQAADVDEGGHFDATGCGDVFLAAMAVSLLTGSAVPTALAQAAAAAARNCTLTGIDDLRHLAEM